MGSVHEETQNMKLKYYFRGLGAGILFTAVVFSFIIIPKYKMTDDEIKDAAAELGMVDESKEELNIDAIKLTPTEASVVSVSPGVTPEGTNTVTPTNSESGTALTVTPIPSDASATSSGLTGEPTKEAAITPSVTPTVTPTVIPTKEPSATPVPATSTPAPATSTPVPVTDSGSDTGNSITVTIKSGMTSESFASLLYDKGLVDSASDFNRFMVTNDYANYIKVGTFVIPEGATYAQIAYIVTNIR